VSGTEVRILAQAKINLYLRILARESSGYHQLETLFLRLTLADEIVVRTGVTGRTVDCRGADAGPMERNLAYRAALAMRDAGGPDTFAIEIEKRIPIGAGLGGGSADAAAVLRALNAAAARPLPDEQILALAGRLGADVPFLASGSAMALAWGRGERMLAIEPPPSRPVLVLAPPFGVSTPAAYGWIDAAQTPRAAPRLLVPEALAGWSALERLAHNDFEPVVVDRHPEIAGLIGALRTAGANPAMMSGTGSAVFGVFSGMPQAPVVPAATRVIGTTTAESVEEPTRTT
jgi:4-diphosphocytidyl-2-C-methyl-D-erythritol kinase